MAIFEKQDNLTLRVYTDTDLTSATTALIKYRPPYRTIKTFVATVTDAANGIIEYNLQPGELSPQGEWTFWASITFSDGRVSIGEPFTVEVFDEG